jgi:hypothetical protein
MGCTLFIGIKGLCSIIVAPSQQGFPYLLEDLVGYANLGYTYLSTL